MLNCSTNDGVSPEASPLLAGTGEALNIVGAPLVSGSDGGDSDKQDHFHSEKIVKGNNHSIYYANLDTFSNKKEEIIDVINNESPDILAFTELLNKKCPSITKAELKLNGYDEFYKDEDKNDKMEKRRGVILYTKRSLNAKHFTGLDNLDFKEHIWCTFETNNKEKILIGVVYHSGSSTEENTQRLYEVMRSDTYKDYDRVFICGDFNYPTARWDGTWSNERDEAFHEAVRDGFFTQHVTQPTRYRDGQQSNVLDLVFSRDEGDINNIYYCSPLGKSDHVLLKIITTIPTAKVKTTTSKRYDWKNGDFVSLRKFIADIDWTVLKEMDVEGCWKFIKSKLQEGIDLFIPIKICTDKVKDKPPWMSHHVKKNVKKKYLLFKRFIDSDSSTDYKEYIKMRNDVTKLIKRSKILHEKKVASQSKKNPKSFWKHVNSFRKCRENVSALQREDGSLATSDQEKADMLIKFFSSVLTVEDMTNIPHIPPGENSNGEFVTKVNITEPQVKEKLKNLDPNKSPGPDKIYPRILKELNEELAGPLAVLFNKSLREGKLPSEWKLAEITAIFKKGNRMSSNNYRPVSLTCILCKVMESFIRDVVQHHMEHFNLYCKCQHGFRKGKSCTTQLLEVMDDFSKYIDNGQAFDVIYLDFKKAFDSVPHERLLVKLKSYGIDGELHDWIKDFLSERLQYVKVGASCSSTMKVTSGIPQGSILGPILFLIFINDLPECVQSISTIFADDTKAYNTCDKCEMIQEDINALQIWSHKWQLYFNCSKCKCLHFGKNNPCKEYFFHTDEGNAKIPQCSEEKDLGVIFDTSLKFDLHIDAMVSKANSMIGLIKRNFSFMNIDMFLHLYKALIRPHLEYGQLIWSPRFIRQSKKIENVQRRATKIVPCLMNLSYDERLRKLRLPTLKYRRLRGDMLNVYKILNDDKKGSSHLLPLHESNHSTRGHDKKLQKNRYKCNFRKFSFSLRVTNNWNSLSKTTTNAVDINQFKKLLDNELCNVMYEYD